jgi:uncharacterized phage-associated protein
MATALDVGQYVYQRMGWIDAWRLQKLVFFSHAWSLAWDGRGLFDTQVEAWPDGPVERDLYRVNKYERSGILSTDLPGADAWQLTPRQRAIIDAVLEHYGECGANELSDQSHTPIWEAARGEAGRHARGRTIPVNAIRRWYTRAALSGEDVPSPPVQHVAVLSEVSDEMIEDQIGRWRGVLDLLAER